MKRNFAIVVLAIVLFAVATIEETWVHNFCAQMATFSHNLEIVVTQNQNGLDRNEVEVEYEKLNSFWQNEKIKMCYFTNYDKIRVMDESMIKLGIGIKQNDHALVAENLGLVLQFGNMVHFSNGFNLNNLF